MSIYSFTQFPKYIPVSKSQLTNILVYDLGYGYYLACIIHKISRKGAKSQRTSKLIANSKKTRFSINQTDASIKFIHIQDFGTLRLCVMIFLG